MSRFGSIGIVGAGGWGTALGLVALAGCPDVTLWAHRAEHAADLRKHRVNQDYLPGVSLPEALRITSDLGDLARCELILVVVPSKAIREIAGELRSVGIPSGTPMVCCTKGIEHGTGRLMGDLLLEEAGISSVAVLSGPNLASEIARHSPTAAVVASTDEGLARRVQASLTAPWFRLYTSGDPRGVQLGGALKNVYAIGAGSSDGLGMGQNAKAALVTRSLAEMIRMGLALGGKAETFQGLSGIGDLMVTCFSDRSRNHQFGVRIAGGESAEEILGSMRMVAEGVPTARSAYDLARESGVDTPVIDQVYRVLYEGQKPKVAIQELLARTLKSEGG